MSALLASQQAPLSEGKTCSCSHSDVARVLPKAMLLESAHHDGHSFLLHSFRFSEKSLSSFSILSFSSAIPPPSVCLCFVVQEAPLYFT